MGALTAQVATLQSQLKLKNDEIKNLREAINELNIKNIDLQNIEELSLLDENTNTFIPQLHACVYILLDCHVSCENVSKVIENVLKLSNKKAAKLSSVCTVNTCNWSVGRNIIARKHF